MKRMTTWTYDGALLYCSSIASQPLASMIPLPPLPPLVLPHLHAERWLSCHYPVSLGFYTPGSQNFASLQRFSLIPSPPSFGLLAEQRSWSRYQNLALLVPFSKTAYLSQCWLKQPDGENTCGFCLFRFPQPSCLDQGVTGYFGDIGKCSGFHCHFGSVCWWLFFFFTE